MHIDSAKGERLEGIKNKIKKGRINYIEKTAADAVMILLTSADLNLFITPSNRGRLLWTANHLSHFFRLDSAVVCFADFFLFLSRMGDMGGHSFIRDRSVHYNADACVCCFWVFYARGRLHFLVYIISENDARSMCGIFVQRHSTMGR
jgi:hypothetical protein